MFETNKRIYLKYLFDKHYFIFPRLLQSLQKREHLYTNMCYKLLLQFDFIIFFGGMVLNRAYSSLNIYTYICTNHTS